jgi:hypothetical protein
MRRVADLLHARRRVLALVPVIVAALAAVSFAYFSASGIGTAAGQVGTLASPAITSTSAGAGQATINWSTITAPASGTVSYYVTRNGGTPAGDCPTASSPSSTKTSCTDTGLGATSYTYRIVAVWHSWSASSAPATVTLSSGAASKIVLTQSITGTSFASGSTDALTATIEDAAGNTVTTGSDATDSITFTQTNTGTGAGSVTGLGSATASTGVATKTITGNQAGAVNLQASGTLNGTATTSNTLNDSVTNGAASKIVLTQSITGTSFASGSTDALTATIEDAAGNTVTTGSDATDSITFTQTNTGTGAGSVTGLGSATASTGVATKTITGNQAGAVNLQASGTLNGTATTSNTLNDSVTGSLTVTYVSNNNDHNYEFHGTGAVNGNSVTVTVCSVNPASSPCPSADVVGSASTVATSFTGGAWGDNPTGGTSGSTVHMPGDNNVYWAQATQGGSTSPSFQFTNTDGSGDPVATGVVVANGGTAGRADAGDTVTIPYSEPIDATTFCSSWQNNGTTQSSTASVTITFNGSASGSDKFDNTIVSGCSFNFGSVALGTNYVTAGTATYAASTVSWNPSNNTLTISLGGTPTLGGGATLKTAVVAATPSYTPSGSLTDLGGQPISPTPVAGTKSGF